MIIIVDNNESYEDHAIGFCSVPNALYAKHKDVVERLALLRYDRFSPGASIVAVASKLDWRESAPPPTLAAVVAPSTVVRSRIELPKPVLNYLLEAWKKVPPGDAEEHLLLIKRFEEMP